MNRTRIEVERAGVVQVGMASVVFGMLLMLSASASATGRFAGACSAFVS